jgi:glycosyltransferase involved in cell wall biosynthesis
MTGQSGEKKPQSMPAVAILMPVRRYHAPFLRKAVASILNQTSDSWNLLIIVEPGDRTKLIGVLASDLRDPRVSIVENEGRKLAGAFNTGMRRTTARFAAILLADDMWAPEAVAVLTRAIRAHPDVDFFHSSRMIVDEHDRPISSVHVSREQIGLEDFVWTGPVKHLLCWRRDLALAVGGMDETLNSVGPDDYDFPWTMAEHGARFQALPECLYLYRDHRECWRLTTHLPLSVHKRELRRILRKHGVDAARIAARLQGAERTYLRQCLFSSRDDERVKTRAGHDARHGWRESYR